MDHDFETDVQVRFRDVDAMGHVNNAVYATYLEQARAAYFDEVIGARLDRVPTVLATQTIDYRRPIEWGDDVTVTLDVTGVGRTSVTMAYEVVANGEVAATAEAVQVTVDDDRDPVPVPDEWRERME